VPVVQAGEQIVFAHEDGQVVAHIQIQYEGAAEEFGWLLPVPSIPEFALGTEELFTQVLQQTQPRYRLNFQFPDQCGDRNVPPGWRGAPGGRRRLLVRGRRQRREGPLVVEASIGPFDYAVLRADDEAEMFDWLVENRYFIPTGTEDVVGPVHSTRTRSFWRSSSAAVRTPETSSRSSSATRATTR
jgi:hypothetical protein